MDYIHDPAEIEHQSFTKIHQLTNLDGLNREQAQVAMRLVHTCGEPEIVEQLVFTPGATSAGLNALDRGKPILCDTEMVRHGITQRLLDQDVHCFLNADDVPEKAKSRGETRSMAALDHWTPHLDGAIAVIGNAPTALFRLLEMIDSGLPAPALIIATPVGFIGAAESKQLLKERAAIQTKIQCITLLGRRGGSAMAASVVNTLSRINRGIYL